MKFHGCEIDFNCCDFQFPLYENRFNGCDF